MSKKTALSTIKKLIKENKITLEDIQKIYGENAAIEHKKSKSFDFLSVLNYLGGAILFFGLVFIVSLFWGDLGDIGQVIMTLGMGILAYVIAIIADTKKSQGGISNPLFLVASLLTPFGVFVFLDKLGTSEANLALVSGFVFLMLAIAYYITDKKVVRNILASFTWIYTTISFGSFIIYFVEQLPDVSYRVFAFGYFLYAAISLLIARYMRSKRLISSNFIQLVALPMYIISLASGITGGIVMDIIFAAVIFGVFWLGSRLESGIYYVNGFVALVVYLTYMNAEYFADLLSWPISLVLIGIIIIGTSNYLIKKRK